MKLAVILARISLEFEFILSLLNQKSEQLQLAYILNTHITLQGWHVNLKTVYSYNQRLSPCFEYKSLLALNFEAKRTTKVDKNICNIAIRRCFRRNSSF